MDPLERFYGAMLGLAVGDCLGMPWEFKPRGSYPPVTGLSEGGVHGARLGEWSDDTAMAFCLAESLIRHRGWDAADAADRFRQWYRAGYWSSRDHCFDIGNATRAAIERFEQNGDPYAGSTDVDQAGNGSIMRLAPIVLFYHDRPELFERVEQSSLLTHGALTCLQSCRLMAQVMRGCLLEMDKADILSTAWLGACQPDGGFVPEVAEIAACRFMDKREDDILSTGYVIHTLEAALWAWASTNTFREAVLLAVSLGDDTDTVGAVTGQIAGTFHGFGNIPREWSDVLMYRRRLIRTTEQLYEVWCS